MFSRQYSYLHGEIRVYTIHPWHNVLVTQFFTFLVATSENNEPYGTQTTRTSPVYRFLAQTL